MTRSLGLAVAMLITATGVAARLAPASVSAQGEMMTFAATLSAANEVPPVANDEKSVAGDVTITLHLTRDANRAITGATADFAGSLKGFPTGSSVTQAHIHRGATGANGPVAVNPGFTAAELALKDGAVSFSKKGVTVTAAVAQEIVANPGNFYFNAHSQMNASGVARGQLAVARPPAAAPR